MFWGATLSEHELPDASDDTSDDDDGRNNSGMCEDFAGYTCTPLTRAYDLFHRLLEQQLLAEDASGHVASGVAGRISARISLRNGEVAAEMCRRRWDQAVVAREKISFVWDFVDATKATSFDSLTCILDAGKVRTLATAVRDDRVFERRYGLPRMLEFSVLSRRQPADSGNCDWWGCVY